MSVEHYENFPVASLLCPPRLRPAVAAIYHYARTADDLADEGDAAPAERLEALAAYRADLLAVVAGQAPSPRWRAVFEPLARAIGTYGLPTPLLLDLLSAFEQDVVKQRYRDRAELLDYCRRSANPVGRLLLHLHGVDDAESLAHSDAICSALQLVNFWQDLGIDASRGRIYAPEGDLARYGVNPDDLLARRDGPAVHRLVAEEVAWARGLMLAGAPLVHRLGGRAGWELRLVVQGGLRIAERIERIGCTTLVARPVLRWHDALALGWRALAMRRRDTHVAAEAA
ncbi:squalene synthase HpnC [Piscinibacter koreensis]|uniref:squalene synthase HpnC n=1 Tax=Piscinibacter koreensis TaxID=2742824 RepID=UPI003158BBD0